MGIEAVAQEAKRWTKAATWTALLLFAIFLLSVASWIQRKAWHLLRKAVPKATNAGVKIKTGKTDLF